MRSFSPRAALITSLSLAFFNLNVLADSVTDWHAFSTQLSGNHGSRTVAIVQAAVFDAVNGIEPKYHFYKIDSKAPGANIDAAVAAASSTVLLALVPEKAKEINELYNKTIASIPNSPSKEAGIEQGKKVANAMLRLRENDGYKVRVIYTQPKKPGIFQLPEGEKAGGIQLPYTHTFVIKSADQFRLSPPEPFTSKKYALDVNEVRSLGSRDSKTRTPEQTEIAKFWSKNMFVTWCMLANQVVKRFGKSEIENARALALFNFAVMDAIIAIFDSKYFYNVWRPIQVLRNAQEINNPLIKPDKTWEPLLASPTNPDYGSAHAAVAGAAVVVLTQLYGEGEHFDLKTEADINLTRHFKNLREAGAESAVSRIYAGLHLRTSTEKGFKLGEQVGEYVMKTTLLPLKK